MTPIFYITAGASFKLSAIIYCPKANAFMQNLNSNCSVSRQVTFVYMAKAGHFTGNY